MRLSLCIIAPQDLHDNFKGGLLLRAFDGFLDPQKPFFQGASGAPYVHAHEAFAAWAKGEPIV